MSPTRSLQAACAGLLALGLMALAAVPAAAHATDFEHANLTLSPTTGSPGTTVTATYLFHPRLGEGCPSGTVIFFWEGKVQSRQALVTSTCSVTAPVTIPADAPGGDHQVCASAPPVPACAVVGVAAGVAEATPAGVAAGSEVTLPGGNRLWLIGGLGLVVLLALLGPALVAARLLGFRSGRGQRSGRERTASGRHQS